MADSSSAATNAWHRRQCPSRPTAEARYSVISLSRRPQIAAKPCFHVGERLETVRLFQDFLLLRSRREGCSFLKLCRRHLLQLFDRQVSRRSGCCAHVGAPLTCGNAILSHPPDYRSPMLATVKPS